MIKIIAISVMLVVTISALGEPFEDVTDQVGMAVPSLAAAWGDYDNDGWVDVYAGGTLMHNDQGKKFTKVANHGLSGQGGLWADYDNDGKLDLYTGMGGNLFRNLGEGKWENQTVKLPARPMKSAISACWGDFDGDGFADLYQGGWEEPSYQPDAIYRNNGDGSFSLHWKGTGRSRPARGVTAADIDLDGDLDIYVSNYRLEQNLLWLNDGKGKFTEVAVERNVAGVYGASQAYGHTIGSSFGDLDNDGLFDLFIGNFSHPPPLTRIARSSCAIWVKSTAISLKI